ncbi:colanic acid/amylovoran biosynthesis glycosyltransferase [Lutibacter oceani]|uniref:Colanic acid/amylovoran biosynthesis glycosyltransferase n=1 Tax=Lutibacter oceani TaxID=1853311 RepID=A0A3D9RZB9_9FLAO|nr:glycosyltransferase family 4 protein [Lutibacter oceani]REE81985.1 colanic acid/amylovoran biosynthesis glycosyltransferase [Lutibacter oceani]
MKNPIKIAIYSGVVPSTTFIERLIDGLAKKDHKIYLFGVQNKKIASRKNIHIISYVNKISKFLLLIKYSFLLSLYKTNEKKRLDNIIFNTKKNSRLLKVKYYPVLYHCPDIFHLQWGKGVEDWIWVQEFGMKLILSLRGAHINYSPIADSRLANKYVNLFPKLDGFHAVSKSIASEAMKYNAALQKTKVVYSGLDLEQMSFQLKEIDKKCGLKIISIGREHWKKGYSYALNSMKILKEMKIDFHYTIVGVENNEELLYKRSQFGLENEVTFIGKMPFEEVLKNIKSADVLVLSSVEEGIANVVLEAMALGTLVVSTDCGGMNEVIINNENGYLIPIRDPESMASTLFKVSDLSLKNYQNITCAARKTIEKQHSHEKMIHEMNELYLKVLKN